MGMACPECGGRKIRLSKVHGMLERFGTLFGYYPMRCSDCAKRFKSRIWSLAHLVFAKCPRCHKMDLAKWSEHYYNAPLSQRLKMTFGGQRRRCVYCRHNFVSWRPLRERYNAQNRVNRSVVRVPVSQPEQNPPESPNETSGLAQQTNMTSKSV